MAKFFVPDISDPASALAQYESVKSFLVSKGYEITDETILRVDHTHNDESRSASVGQVFSPVGGKVMAIFKITSGSFLICTTGRGWDKDHLPIHTGPEGSDTIRSVEHFDP